MLLLGMGGKENMETPKLTHNMGSQIIGEMVMVVPFRFTFVYPDNRRNVFDNIVRFAAMKTGCYCLFDNTGRCFVIRPLHEYVIEEPMPNAHDDLSAVSADKVGRVVGNSGGDE
jgi:hypothetical protein